MKRILFFAIIIFPFFAFAQEELPGAIINGSLKNIEGHPSTLYYTYRIADSTVQDSTVINNDQYRFTVKGEMPLRVYLSIADPSKPTSNKNVAAAFIEKGMNTALSVDSFSNITIKESKSQAEYIKLNKALDPYQQQLKALMKSYPGLKEKNDTAGMRKIEEDYDALDNQMREDVYGNYLRNNTTSPIAIYALGQYAGYEIDPVKVKPLFSALPETTKATGAGKQFANRLQIAEATAVGAIAPEFSQTDTSGKIISLSSFRGKYVLVDFWASWCKPCRMENPNVVVAFNKYHDKNFTVLGVSLDDAERDGQKKWLAAIEKDHLTWSHVSDLKYWDNAVAKQYGIRAIPQNLLLDPSGKIIAKNIRGEELQTKLAELL